MADTKSTENKEQTKSSEENTENKDQGKNSDSKSQKKIEYTLLKNVKYGDTPYKVGEKIEIKPDDLEEFKNAGAIKIE